MSIAWVLLKPGQAREPSISKNGSNGTLEEVPIPSQYGKWLLLSSLPSALLLTVSNFIAMEIGSFPMIWIIPLALYLCSFVITFRTHGGVPKLLNIIWPEILLLASAFYLVKPDNITAILGCLLVFFIICILSHGKVYESRPSARWLTNFYLAIAVGGFLGGCSVGLISPFLFKGYFEYIILLIIFGATFWWVRTESFNKFWQRASLMTAAGRIGFILILVTMIAMGALQLFDENVKYRHRNFYGIYRIVEDFPFDGKVGGTRVLIHGNTLHGAQILDPSAQMTPITYYYYGGGISDVYETTPKPRRIAVIGLGAGVVSAYLEEKDLLTFFEIDPDNYEIAKKWFTYIDHCKGRVDVITGDGRLSMKNLIRDGSKYNIIHIDAFTGDGIPTHLLTKEAIEVYLSRLADDGIILFHISNRFYNLRPLIKSTSTALNLYGVMNPPADKTKLKRYQNVTNCVALARNTERLQVLIDRGWVMFSEKDGLSKAKPWTDDYMSILIPLVEGTRKGWAKLM
jgi:spermidine synthase